MVLRHTSTSFATLLKVVGAGVRLARTGKPAAKLARFRHAVRQAVQGTRAALAGPVTSDLAHHLPGSGSMGARVSRLTHSPPRHPLGAYGGRFRAAGFRPHAFTPRGAAIPAHVGLGSARTFATAPAAGAVHSAAGNVPIVLRAFTQIFDDEDKFTRKPLPRGRRYVPYTPASARSSRRATHRARTIPRHVRTASTSSKASLTEQLTAYFPLRPVEEIVPLPPLPESLVTPGMTATLALPLAPALEAILAPTPRVPYADAEVGVSVLARLTHGVMPLHDAYSSYASSRVIPLLARLEALGLLDRRSFPHTKLELLCDNGAPDMLRIHFDDRSAGDVLALLGDQLDGEWFALTDHLKDEPRLSAAEQEEILEDWDAMPHPTVRSVPPPESPVQLVMPTLDMSIAALHTDAPPWPSPPPSLSESFPPSSHGSQSPPDLLSGATTPSMLNSWATSPTLTSPTMSRSLSFISSIDSLAYSLSDSSDPREFSDDDNWAASPPSEADILIESQQSSRSVEVEVSWLQPGLGLMDW